MTHSEIVPYDELLLEKSRTQWQLGDWKSLAELSYDGIHHHPQREKLAILAAAGHLQLGNKNEAYQFIRLAEDWGCSKKLIAQMLISGIHNSLGCAAENLNQHERATQHMHHAVTLGGVPGDGDLLVEVRISRYFGKPNSK